MGFAFRSTHPTISLIVTDRSPDFAAYAISEQNTARHGADHGHLTNWCLLMNIDIHQ